MAEKLSITIALEGGKQIEQQLASIGKAGQQAFTDISKAAQAAGGFKNLKPEEVTAKLQQMGITGKDALDKISGAVQTATRLETLVGVVAKVEAGFANVGAAAASFGRALGPIGIAATAVGIGLVKVMADAATAISKADAEAIKLGLSIEKFSQLKQGFEAAGLSAKAVESGMSAIGKAIEQAKLAQVTKEVTDLQNQLKVGLGGVGLSQFSKLIEMAQGVGKAAEAAQKALADFGITQLNLTHSLPDFINKFGGDVPKAVAAFVEQLRTMPDSANRTERAIAGLGDAGVELVQAFRIGAITADQFRERLTNLTQEQANAANLVTSEWNKLGIAFENLKTTFGGTLLTQDVKDLAAILNVINDLLKPESWTNWGAAASAAILDIIAKIGELLDKLASIPSWLGKVLGGGGEPGSVTPAPGMAGGGIIGGAGSGTSDSNLAWVSRGEHIMPAAVVRQPGVLALLEQLRHGMGHFALGGVVPGLPRFADGGLVGHLGTVDLRTNYGSATVMASASAVEQLSRLAVTRRMTSTGRKPGFIG
jgi:hypothetical protein